jgi:general stress protein 26
MSSEITIEEVKSASAALSMWAHIATVGSDQEPDVVPVHPCWDGETLWIMVGLTSTKTRNVAENPRVALHWQVTENGDGVEVWGTARVLSDIETKRRLWIGVFDYDLNGFAPGGPDNSPDTAFMEVTVERALVMKMYGMGGMQRYSRT